jgi:hypothetical protein
MDVLVSHKHEVDVPVEYILESKKKTDTGDGSQS